MSGGSVVRLTGTGHLPHAACELVYLDIAAIEPYEHNPRRAVNVEYDRIKASIRVDGLGQPLVVTQRPGESGYVVHAGGNTRLRILKELFEETGHARFGTVACMIRPWTREADVLLAHLKENDLRGDLSFLDKALAVVEAKRFLEEEGGTELTQVQLAEALTRSGYGLSQGLISQMVYTVERLRPLLPRALEGGIGRPQISRIRALDRIARAVWLDRSADSEAEYDQAFEALCRRYDTPDWDLDHLRRALEVEIAERAEISIHAVSLEFDTRLTGRGMAAPPRDDATGHGDTPSNNGAPEAAGDGPPQGGSDPAVTAPRTERQAVASSSREAAAARAQQDDTPGQDLDEHPDQDPDEDHEDEPSGRTLGTPAQGDVKSLRARLWTLASRLAQRNGLGDLVHPLSNRGLGFVLRDVPDPALVDRLDEESLAQVSMVWWHLAACAELTVAPLDALLPALPDDSILRRALVEQDAGLLFASVWTLDPGHSGYRLWRRLDERDWQDLLGLMEAYRALHRTAAAGGPPLWSAS